MKLGLKNIDKRWKEYALAGCVCILFLVLITNLSIVGKIIAGFFNIMSPVIIGFVLAYIVNLVAVFFQKRVFFKMKHKGLGWKLSVVLAFIIVLLALALLLMSLIPQIVSSAMTFIDNYPVYVSHLQDFIETSKLPFKDLEFVNNIIEDLSSGEDVLASIGDIIANNYKLIIEKTTSFGGAALNWFLGMIFAIYFLLAKKKIMDAFSKLFTLLLSPLKYKNLKILVDEFNTIFSKYISCELIDSLIIGIVNYIVMIVLKMPNALFVSFVVGVTNLAPTFGPIAGAIIGAFVLLLIKPTSVIPFLILTLVLQCADAYVIKPKLFGDALNVPGVLILIAIIVFGKLMGIIGILIAIPLVAILVYLYKEIFLTWLERRKETNEETA